MINHEKRLKNRIEIYSRMQNSLCSSPWIDYTKAHETTRKELENAIVKYVINNEKGIRAPVVVAPYGSGKTTLLRHLLCYSISRDIPAIKINLRSFVSFLKSLGTTNINEDNLIGYLSLFCRNTIKQIINYLQSNEQKQTNINDTINDIIDEFNSINANKNNIINILSKFLEINNQKCVLLIDEIEESYSKLNQIVEHETTPFRGVFDMVVEGKSRIFPVLAFGPSSIYSEVVSNAGSWRVISYVIPMITPINIAQKITDSSPRISNLIWWLGKGRPGHVDKIIQMKMHTEIQNSLVNCRSILETDVAKNLQGTYVVSNIPYIDQAAYRRVETSLNDYERSLFHLLSVLVGPIPESELKNYKCIDINKIKYSKLPDYFIRSAYLIKVDDILSTLEKVFLNLGYAMNDFARDMLYALFYSWSDHNMMILDKRVLAELIGIAKDMAIEFYQNELFNALSKLDLDTLYTELSNNKIDGKEYYYALSPLTLNDIYPPVLLMPLIGCCKEKSLNDLYEIYNKKFTINDIFNLSTKLQEEIINYANMRKLLGNNVNEYKIVFVLSKFINNEEFIKQIKKLLTKDGVNGVIFIPLPYNQDPSLMINSIRELWQKYIDVGLIDIIYPSARALLFLMGLIYNNYIGCNVKYTDRELSMYDQFMRAVIELLKEAVNNRLPTKRNEIVQAVHNVSTTIKDLEEISSDGYRRVGSGKERYLLLLTGAEHRNILEQYLETLIARKSTEVTSTNGIIEDLVKKVEDFIDELHNHGISIDDKVTSGFESFLKNGWDYYEDLRSNWDKIYNEIQSKSIFNDVFDVLSELYAVSDILNDKNDMIEILKLIKNLSKITKKVVGVSEDSMENLITWIALQKMLSKYPNIPIFNDEEKCRDAIKELASSFDKVSILGEIARNVNEVLNKVKKYGITSLGIVNTLGKIIKMINDVRDSISKLSNYIENCSNRLTDLNTVEKMWFIEFIMKGWGSGKNKGLISNLLDNVSGIVNSIDLSLGEKIESISSSLNEIENALESLEKLTAGSNESSLEGIFAMIDYNALMQYYKEDLNQVLSNSGNITELDQNLVKLKEVINNLVGTINIMRKDDTIQRLMNNVVNNIKEITNLLSQEIEGGGAS